jgi:3-oxocholest-4-en-26-oate---CoA ligase
MELHFATVWEAIADELPDSPAVVNGVVRRSWREYDDRAARLAAAFTAAGLGPQSKVGLYLYNSNEYLEAQFGAFKIRAVPVNVNYRYLDDELAYLLNNSDAEAIVFHRSLGERVARVKPRLPGLKLLVEVDDGGEPADAAGTVAYEELVASHEPQARQPRREDDLYMLYTGGTTGMPKGVMYAIGGMTDWFVKAGFPSMGLTAPSDPAQIGPLVAEAARAGQRSICMPACPLMHGTGMWLGAFVPHLLGGTVITLQGRSLDAHELLEVAQREQATALVIVGDAFAKPIVRALDEATERGEPYDTSSLQMVVSSGVMWTAEVKEAMLERMPQLVLVDAIGSTEGSIGLSLTMKGVFGETAKFTRDAATKVFTEDGREVTPGSGEVGLVAAGGNVPLGYYKDSEKSSRTFRVIDGVRYSFAGDLATVHEDGSLILLGRGSQVINSAGEKVFPEEVEEAVKRVSGVNDCLVVGLEDERFGEVVAAVASLVPGAAVDEATIIAAVKQELAGFKAPRRVVFVAEVPRAANGKADYRAAKRHLLAEAG